MFVRGSSILKREKLINNRGRLVDVEIIVAVFDSYNDALDWWNRVSKINYGV